MPDRTIGNEREVGRVVGVSTYRVTVLLDSDLRSPVRAYPHHITTVSQIGGYVLFPVAPGETAVGIVVGAFEDESIEPESDRSMTLTLARARKTIRLNLLGQLTSDEFIAGISVYPTLDTPALLPTDQDLVRILHYKPRREEQCSNTALAIGVSPLYARQAITASFNDLLARPLGVVGNTGSGKSYTVASIVQEALRTEGGKAMQAKVVILDINGEYAKAFDRRESATARELNEVYVNGHPFQLPLWVFNLGEMVAFFEASQASQVPVLERVVTALREQTSDPGPAATMRNVVRMVDQCREYLDQLSALAVDTAGMAVSDNAAEVMKYLRVTGAGLLAIDQKEIEIPEPVKTLEEVLKTIETAGLSTVDAYKTLRKNKDYSGFNRLEPAVTTALHAAVEKLGPEFERIRSDAMTKGGLQEVTADTPVPFSPHALDHDAPFREAVSRFRGQQRIQEYIATLRLRIHRQLSDRRWTVFTDESDVDFQSLLGAITGDDGERVVVIDCSTLAHDVLPFFCAVLGRLLLELREHASPEQRTVQPFVVVLEEAHNYLRPRRDDESFGLRLSRESFERIAKEGRKFGLSLVIASQRPADVSATVLSQCANFLVHRIQNPEDIDYFKKILPTGSRDLLDQLPILAPGEGLLLGSAVNVPVRVRVRRPDPEPSSETPAPWKAWQTGAPQFPVKEVADAWATDGRRHDDREKGSPPEG